MVGITFLFFGGVYKLEGVIDIMIDRIEGYWGCLLKFTLLNWQRL